MPNSLVGLNIVTDTQNINVNLQDHLIDAENLMSLTLLFAGPSTSGGSTPTPRDIPGLLAFWENDVGYYSDLARTTPISTEGDLVASWYDPISGYALEQATSAKRIALKNAANGQLCMATSGTPNELSQFYTWPNLSINLRSSTLFYVIRPVGVGPSQPFCLASLGAGVGDLLLDSDGTAAVPMVTRSFKLGDFQNGNTTNKMYCDPYLTYLSLDSSSRTAVIDTQSTTIPSALANISVNSGRLFNWGFNDASPAKAEIYAVGVIDHPITPEEAEILQEWAATYLLAPSIYNLVCRGDSLTEGYLTTLGRNWPILSADSLGAGWRLWNQGISGYTCQSLAGNFATSTAPLYNGSMTKNVYAHWLGTNDLGIANRTAAELIADTSTVLTAAKNAGFTTVVGTIPNRDGSTDWDSTKNGYRITYNTAIRPGGSLASLVDVLADVSANILLDDPDNFTYRFTDHLHYVQAGSTLLSTAIFYLAISSI